MLSNYSKTCAKNLPGNRAEVYITEIGNITSITDARLDIGVAIHSYSQSGDNEIEFDIKSTEIDRVLLAVLIAQTMTVRVDRAVGSPTNSKYNGVHFVKTLSLPDAETLRITTTTTWDGYNAGESYGFLLLKGQTDNLIETVVMGAGLKFHKFQVDIDTIQATNTAGNNANEFKLIFKLAVHTKSVETFREALSAAVVAGVAAIRVDGNNRCFLSGASDGEKEGLTRPYTKVEYTFDSGIMPTDENMQALTVTLTRQGGVNETEFDATNTAAILAGTATFIEW